MGKQLAAGGEGAGGARGARGCGAGFPPASRPSVPLRGAQRGGGALLGAVTGEPASPGSQPAPDAGASGRSGREAGCGRALFEKEMTKSSGGPGLPGRLYRNSSRCLLTEMYRVLLALSSHFLLWFQSRAGLS